MREIEHEITKAKQQLEEEMKIWEWIETNALHIFDGGGAIGIEFGLLSNPQKIEDQPSFRQAVLAAMSSASGNEERRMIL